MNVYGCLVDTLKIKYLIFRGQNSEDGVTKKSFGQISELIRLGLDVEMVLISVGNVHYASYDFITVHVVDKVPTKNVFGQLKRARKFSKIFGETIDSLGLDDILYYRFTSLPLLYYPYKYFKRFRICKIVTEHQSRELDELKINGNIFNYWFELIFGRFLKMQSDAIIGVTNEITQYEIVCAGDFKKPHLTIGNGFLVKSVPIRQTPHYNSEEFHLLCVANINRWHGLDRLLRGLANYSGTPRVVLHVAGDGPELSHLQKLADDLSIPDRVIFHGFLTGKALDALFDQCQVAVGSLGIHRKGLTQTSELKTREYCARGIPYVIAVFDPDFPEDFPYIFHLPFDENPIDVEKVLAFARTVCGDPDHPQKMRRYAEERLDWSVKMKKLGKFLESLVNVNEK